MPPESKPKERVMRCDVFTALHHWEIRVTSSGSLGFGPYRLEMAIWQTHSLLMFVLGKASFQSRLEQVWKPFLHNARVQRWRDAGQFGCLELGIKSEGLPGACGSVKLGGHGEDHEVKEISLELLVVYCSQLLLKRRGNFCMFYGGDNSVN